MAGVLRNLAQKIAQRSDLKRIVYPVANALFRAVGHIRAQRYDIQDTIVVAASPRGGSTWLAELMASRPGAIILWEPLHPGNNPVCRKHGFGWQNYIPEGVEWTSQRQYLEDVLTGRDLSTRLLTSLEFDPLALLSSRGPYVAKFVNANMVFPRIVEAFSVSAVHMIRHPCAVVSSQMKHGSWGHLKKKNLTIPDGLFDDHPHLASVFGKMKHHEELLAFEWAVQNYVPLSQPEPLPWYVTTYERMVMKGEKEIRRLSDALGLSKPSSEILQLDEPSATASEEEVEQPEERLTKWKRNLSPKQADRILLVAHSAGVKSYAESPMPDRSKLPRHVGTTSSKG
jgi:hypothetical protein